VQEIFEENKSTKFQGAIIWTPMLVTASLLAAKGRETRLSDPRIEHYWDPDRVLDRLLAQTLGLKAPIAWDVYLVYLPDPPWGTELPPPPGFWMHQLNEEPTHLLDPLRLKHFVQTLIEEL
jgi:hypothetical protein